MYRYPLLIAPATSQNQSTMLLVANPEDEQVVVQVISSAAQDIALEARSYRTLLLPRTISQVSVDKCERSSF